MHNKGAKRPIAYEALIFLGLLALFLLITRVWPLLFLVILGIFIAALCLLFRHDVNVEVIVPVTNPPPSGPETENDILRRAFGLIQRRITEEVEFLHPSARWQWLAPNPMAAIEKDIPVAIILNGAGGYRKASVRIHNLAYRGLVFETAAENPDSPQPSDDPASDNDEDDNPDTDEPVNYEYLAFEWVEAHLLRLNELGNEAIGQGQSTLLIPAADLPLRDSWTDICKQLIANDFSDAAVNDDGILVSLQQ